jgi:hypothetical protein
MPNKNNTSAGDHPATVGTAFSTIQSRLRLAACISIAVTMLTNKSTRHSSLACKVELKACT